MNLFKKLLKSKKHNERIEITDTETGEITTDVPDFSEERGLPSVNKGTSIQSKLTNTLAAIFIIAIAVFFLWQYYSGLLGERNKREALKEKDTTRQSAVIVPPLATDQLNAANFVPAPPPPPEPAPIANAGTMQSMNMHGASNAPPPKTPDELAAERKLNSPVAFKFNGGPETYSATVPQTIDAGNSARQDKLAEALKPTYTAGVKATLLPDRDLFMTKGTMLDCALDPAINSSQPGMITCFLSRDVRGASGRVILLDKGTKLTGEYHGDPKGSDARIFVLWSRAETTNGVIVELASPGTDSLGRAGMDGYVDTHFMERFGSAIMVSIIGDAATGIANRKAVDGNNNSVSFSTTPLTTAELAVEIIKQQGNIPNTLNQHQAAHMNVYVARDLDFRGVYSLEPQ